MVLDYLLNVLTLQTCPLMLTLPGSPTHSLLIAGSHSIHLQACLADRLTSWL